MARPIIVITAGRHRPASAESSTAIVGCDIDYLVSVSLAGGAAVMLPGMADHESIRAVLQVSDGLLLTGGGDIHAAVYGEDTHPASMMTDPDRDNMELEVIRLALEIGLPILGICRGLQMLNVAHGGTLVQDIPSMLPEAIRHHAAETETLLHPIFIAPDTLLARVMHTASMAVNSWHHQAVNELGVRLRVSARAEDGLIEAIESAEGKPILAVQCHPEVCEESYPCYLTLFHWLIEEAQLFYGRR